MTHLLAQLSNPVLPKSIGAGNSAQGGSTVGLLISNTISGMILIAFIVAFFYLITGGFHWITSAGDKANLESARNKIIHAILGLVVVAATWAIAILVGQFIGLDFTHLPVPAIK